ncbi:unnamed protein product (macronuclear) [Paramecium tetraurelia]|uniref:EF-hand domain-containing protein n=1 Tax=Paramecium tetraurelia TaxID=5888 RepID=A0D9P6_PARTE|nr:uncharacterized protein GSPATT00014694001 [Paramecium tetraurelia]CAK79763.1 unnamed protein product [Paramecium tetraurelia]|eukprot:XP_001447160.1 hypothetical protein (macronuclear) [Paramecium tetraurelia strain d4-2]
MNQPNKQPIQQQPQQANAKRQSAIQLKKYINQLQGTGVLGKRIYNFQIIKYLVNIMTMCILIRGKWRESQKKFLALRMAKSLCRIQKRECVRSYNKIELCNPNADISLINTVFQGKQEVSAKDIYELWNGEPITDYDPLQECLNLLCDQNEILDLNKMSQLMETLGYQKLDKQDQVILIEIFDIYRDKKIDKKDLMAIFTYILQHTTGI